MPVTQHTCFAFASPTTSSQRTLGLVSSTSASTESRIRASSFDSALGAAGGCLVAPRFDCGVLMPLAGWVCERHRPGAARGNGAAVELGSDLEVLGVGELRSRSLQCHRKSIGSSKLKISTGAVELLWQAGLGGSCQPHGLARQIWQVSQSHNNPEGD